MLSALCQAVSLIQYDHLCVAWRQVHFLLCKLFYLLSDCIDSSFIRGVQLLHCLLGLVTKELPYDTQNWRCFSDSRRSRQDHVRNGPLRNTGLEGRQLIEIPVNLFQRLGSVFFEPDLFHMAPNWWLYKNLFLKVLKFYDLINWNLFFKRNNLFR